MFRIGPALVLCCGWLPAQEFGGRIDLDAVVPRGHDRIESDVGPIEEDAEVRRARLHYRQSFADVFAVFVQTEFAEDDIEFRSAYLELTELACGINLRLGSFKEPFGLEQQTGTREILFMERALTSRIAPGRNTGLRLSSRFGDSGIGFDIGVFRDPGGKLGLGPDDDAWSGTARTTWLPWPAEEQDDVLHVGASISHRWSLDGMLSFSARPELRLVPPLVRTGPFAASRELIAGTEAAWVHGATSLQAEWVQTHTDGGSSGAGSQRLFGGYLQVSHFVTGERRNYDPVRRRFVRVEPDAGLFAGGAGAVELKARVSLLDVGSRFAPNERLVDFTTGVNWYLNRSTRVMADVVYGERSDFGSVLALGLRFQISF